MVRIPRNRIMPAFPDLGRHNRPTTRARQLTEAPLARQRPSAVGSCFVVRWRSHKKRWCSEADRTRTLSAGRRSRKTEGRRRSYSAARAEPRYDRPTSEPKIFWTRRRSYTTVICTSCSNKKACATKKRRGWPSWSKAPAGSAHGARGFETLPSPPTVFPQYATHRLPRIA